METVRPHRKHGAHLPELDGLRAIAALLVVVHHAGQKHLDWIGGWAGVPIFFVLSGYLITRLSLADEGRGGFSFRAFWVRRLTRIVPLYVLAVVLFSMLPLAGEGGGVSELRRVLPYYLTFNAEYAPHGPMVIAWSLGIEEKFYIAWPVIAFVLLRRARWRLPVTVAGAALTLCIGAATGMANINCYGALLLGCSLAFLEDRYGWLSHGRRAPFGSSVFGASAIGALVAGLLLSQFAPNDDTVYLYLTPVVGVLVIHLVYGSGRSRAMFANRHLVWIGHRSYGLYLFHTFALAVAAHFVGSSTTEGQIASGAVCIGGGILMAGVAHRVVEVPFIRLGRGWAARLKPQQPSVDLEAPAEAEASMDVAVAGRR